MMRLLPRSLFARSAIIMVAPVIILQVLSTYIFYNRHWDALSHRLASAVVDEMMLVLDVVRDESFNTTAERSLLRKATKHLDLSVVLHPNTTLPKSVKHAKTWAEMLQEELAQRLTSPYQITTNEDFAVVHVQLSPQVVVDITVHRKRLFSSTTYIYIAWTLGSALILFAVALLFMRGQVNAIRRLAIAADRFGKGQDVPDFKPRGAAEVRQAAQAFIRMRERVQRQIQQRTEMLAGVSHDLRTPLTRMKLGLAMMPQGEAVRGLKDDVQSMEKMIESYLAFVRGEGGEAPTRVDLVTLIKTSVPPYDADRQLTLTLPEQGWLTARPQALQRCLTNLINNALRHAPQVQVSVTKDDDHYTVLVDDNGAGIPPDKREDVFRPFVRLDAARSPVHGGVGLGLTIARDIARAHGGDVTLHDSPLGGLQARLRLPL